MNTNSNPIGALSAAEQQLIDAIDATTQRVEQIGTNAIDAALSRLHDAINAAAARVARATTALGDMVQALAGDMSSIASGIRGDLAEPIATTTPTPTAASVIEPKCVEPVASDAIEDVVSVEPATTATQSTEVSYANSRNRTPTNTLSSGEGIPSTVIQSRPWDSTNGTTTPTDAIVANVLTLASHDGIEPQPVFDGLNADLPPLASRNGSRISNGSNGSSSLPVKKEEVLAHANSPAPAPTPTEKPPLRSKRKKS